MHHPGAIDGARLRMSPPSQGGVLVLDVALRPYELLAGWRPASRTLKLTVPEAPPSSPATRWRSARDGSDRRQRVQARISVLGLGVAATITGRARAAGLELELEPDDPRVRTLERLVEVAGGARGAYQPRSPRYRAPLTAVVSGLLDGPILMKTRSVSEGGCALAWTGPTPDLGVPLELRIGHGRRVADFCGEVAWSAPTGRDPAVGVQFIAGDRITWAHILLELERAGTPRA